MYDFMPEPKEEWAKQIIYDPIPFENVIQSGSTIINPNVYFSLRTPDESDLRQMLNGITLEKDALHLETSTTHTQVKSQRKPSEPFSKPAVTRVEKTQAAAIIQENGILPVNQIIRDFSKEHHIQLIEKQMTASEEVNQTEPISALDLNDLAGNIPSLKPVPPPVVTEVFSEDSSLMLNESLLNPPHLPPIPHPVSPSPSEKESDQPILNLSVNSTHFSQPIPHEHPTATPLFNGSSTDLMGKLLFGSKEAAKDILESPPIETFFTPRTDPAGFSTLPQVHPSEYDHPSPLFTPLSSQINKSMGFSEIEVSFSLPSHVENAFYKSAAHRRPLHHCTIPGRGIRLCSPPHDCSLLHLLTLFCSHSNDCQALSSAFWLFARVRVCDSDDSRNYTSAWGDDHSSCVLLAVRCAGRYRLALAFHLFCGPSGPSCDWLWRVLLGYCNGKRERPDYWK